jgi:hypothetical protein
LKDIKFSHLGYHHNRRFEKNSNILLWERVTEWDNNVVGIMETGGAINKLGKLIDRKSHFNGHKPKLKFIVRRGYFVEIQFVEKQFWSFCQNVK